MAPHCKIRDVEKVILFPVAPLELVEPPLAENEGRLLVGIGIAEPVSIEFEVIQPGEAFVLRSEREAELTQIHTSAVVVVSPILRLTTTDIDKLSGYTDSTRYLKRPPPLPRFILILLCCVLGGHHTTSDDQAHHDNAGTLPSARPTQSQRSQI